MMGGHYSSEYFDDDLPRIAHELTEQARDGICQECGEQMISRNDYTIGGDEVYWYCPYCGRTQP